MKTKTDLLLISPYTYFHAAPGTTAPSSIAYIASYIRDKGYKVAMLDAYVANIKNEKILAYIVQCRPRLIGISVNLFTAKSTIHLVKLIRKELDTPIILGGPFASSSPEYLLNNTTGTIGIVIGEGEIATYRILQNLESKKFIFDGLKNVCYYNNGNLVKFQDFERILDLDSLPFPAWDLIPNLNAYNLHARMTPSVPMITSRGCPHKCTFCSRTVFGSRLTMRSPANVVEEIDWAIKTFGVKHFDIMDDNFSASVKRTHEIFDLLLKKKRNIGINIQNMRADRVDEELMMKMKKVGVFKIAIGIENGDEKFLKRMKKDLSLDKVVTTTRLAKKHGIAAFGYFILGLPGESRHSMLNTIKFAKELNPTIANFMIAVPVPGSDLYREVKEKGKLLIETQHGLSSTLETGEVYFEIGKLTKEDVRYCFKKAYRSFYFRLPKMIEVLLSFRSKTEWTWFFKMAYFFLENRIRMVLKKI